MDKKIFVLDTSVIIYDHRSIMNFDEHDVVLPITVLEELDTFKKGNDTKNFEAREFIRFLDKTSKDHLIKDWIPLPGEEKGSFKIVMETNGLIDSAIKTYGTDSMDNRILNSCLLLAKEEKKRQVILVTKDVNLRLKAKAKDHKISFDQIEGKMDISPNAYYILQGEKSSALAYYNPFAMQLERVNKQMVFNIKPRNAEQAFAIHSILQPEIKLVALHGVAGTGKTLIALAAAIAQRRDFKQIYLARPIVPLSNRDLGYLPGDIKSKIDPYMQPLWDNLKFIQYQFDEHDKEYKQINIMVEQEKLLITPLAYIRGRSLSDVIFIVDEAQNLTPHEVKTIITRAGENSKFIFTGDIKQIDTPYLDEQSNGLSYLVDRIEGQKLFSHIQLIKGERSELANLANDLL